MIKMTVDKLAKIREKALASRVLGKNGTRVKITVHMGTCGIASGSAIIYDRLTQLIREHKIKDIQLISSGCAGLCSREPMITVQVVENPPAKYADLTAAKVTKIFKEHVMKGKLVRSSLLAIGSEMTC